MLDMPSWNFPDQLTFPILCVVDLAEESKLKILADSLCWPATLNNLLLSKQSCTCDDVQIVVNLYFVQIY
jgi:hypothetical protein